IPSQKIVDGAYTEHIRELYYNLGDFVSWWLNSNQKNMKIGDLDKEMESALTPEDSHH
ncbi:unnamed protein product, partial [marine sediment metagenome]